MSQTHSAATDGQPASLGELTGQLSQQISTLVRDELRLAQAELTAKGKKVGIGAGLFGAALMGKNAVSTAAPVAPTEAIAGVEQDVDAIKHKKSWFAVLRRAVKQVGPDELTDRAAALTYYGIQAIFPGVLVLVSIVGLLGHSTAQSLIDNLGSIAPGTVKSFLRSVIENAQSQKTAAGILGIIGILAALWSASGYVSAFMRASNRIYSMPEGRPIWKTAPVRLGVTLFTVVCLVLGIVIVVVTGTIADQVGSALGIGSTAVTVWDILKWPVLLLIVVLMLAVLYNAAPNVRHGGFRWITPGAALSVVIWLIASALFAFYVANFSSYNKTYGSVATVIIFLVWMWITNLSLLLGVEFDAELEHERALREGVPAKEDLFAVAKDTRKFDDEEKRAAERVESRRRS